MKESVPKVCRGKAGMCLLKLLRLPVKHCLPGVAAYHVLERAGPASVRIEPGDLHRPDQMFGLGEYMHLLLAEQRQLAEHARGCPLHGVSARSLKARLLP